MSRNRLSHEAQQIVDRRKYLEGDLEDDPDDSPWDPDNETEPSSPLPPSVKKPMFEEHEKLSYQIFKEELENQRFLKLLRIIQHIMWPANSDRDLRELFDKLKKAEKNQAGGGNSQEEETTCSFANTSEAMPRDIKLSYLTAYDQWYLRATEDTEEVWIRPPEKWEENGRYYIFDPRVPHCAYYPLPHYFPLAADTMQIYKKMYSGAGGGEVMTYFPEYSVWAIWNGSSWFHQEEEEEGFTPSEYPLSLDLAWLKPEHYGKLVELLREHERRQQLQKQEQQLEKQQREGGGGGGAVRQNGRHQSRRRKGSRRRRRSGHRKKK